MILSKPTRTIVLGLVLGFSLPLGYRLVQKGPEIVIAWGNAWAERERRLAAAEIRQDEERKEQKLRRTANEEWNEAHCKVTIVKSSFSSSELEVVTSVRYIRRAVLASDPRAAFIGFGGGTERSVLIMKTENCR